LHRRRDPGRERRRPYSRTRSSVNIGSDEEITIDKRTTQWFAREGTDAERLAALD
jgi:hypothetical protein